MSTVLHLARRFFRSLRARHPHVDDQLLVGQLLSTPEADVFWEQPVPDVVHALRAARHVLAEEADRTDLARAALLHDVGKRHAGIGTFRRSFATASAAVRLPVGTRATRYLEHAESGAVELESLGCDEIVIGFARHHHGSRPQGFAPQDWELLLAADHE